MQKKTKIFLGILLLVIICVSAYRVYDAVPPKIVSVSALLGGGDGSLIIVEYQTDKPIKTDFIAKETYLIVEESGTILAVKWIPKIGTLLSKSEGKNIGWFVIDNGSLEVVKGTNVTIIIGDFRRENYSVIGTL